MSEDFEPFFVAYRRRVTLVVGLITQDRAEAEEIAQDAFLAVWERWDRVRSLDDPAGYLFRTAINLARKRRRRALLAVRRLVHLAAPEEHPFDDVSTSDLVQRAMAGLTRTQRGVVILVDALGYTSVEAGRLLGISASTVRVHLARARTSLRESLEVSE